MTPFELDRNGRQIYVIFSVDTEHDTIVDHSTRTMGWSKGIPRLCETFNAVGMKGKVCWLIEYNLKEGIPASNPNSGFFVKEFPELITQIKTRGDEFGVHPTMYDWIGGETQVSASSYNNHDLWDVKRSFYDSEFVRDLITSAVKEIKVLSGVNPVGCRTGASHYATHLATNLEKNGVNADSSVFKKTLNVVTSPNAYYVSGDDIRRKSPSKTGVLEIPTVSCRQFNLQDPLTRIRTEYLLHLRQPILLSLFIHNWDAITTNGEENEIFLENLSSFLRFLLNRGVRFLSWREAKEGFESVFRPSDCRDRT